MEASRRAGSYAWRRAGQRSPYRCGESLLSVDDVWKCVLWKCDCHRMKYCVPTTSTELFKGVDFKGLKTHGNSGNSDLYIVALVRMLAHRPHAVSEVSRPHC